MKLLFLRKRLFNFIRRKMAKNYFSGSFKLQVRSKFLKRTARSTRRALFLSVKRAEDCVFPLCACCFFARGVCTRLCTPFTSSESDIQRNVSRTTFASDPLNHRAARESRHADNANGRGVSNPICRGRATVHPTLHVSQTFRWSLFTWPIDPATSTETDPTWFAISFDTIVQRDEKNSVVKTESYLE